MASIAIGKLQLSARAGAVLFTIEDAKAILSPRDVTQLRDFLREFAPQERRLGFRVPLAGISHKLKEALEVELHTPSESRPAKAVDLSLTGVLLEVAGTYEPEQEVVVRMALEEHTCELGAIVVRRDGELCALHFPEALKGGELDPPEALREIFLKLEQAWLKLRIA